LESGAKVVHFLERYNSFLRKGRNWKFIGKKSLILSAVKQSKTN